MFERFDIDLNDEADELMDSIDEMIFDDDDQGEINETSSESDEKKLEKDELEEDDTISEEDLEKLLIGIDEENGILDIPDEEEVLEELKFVDDLPKEKGKGSSSKSASKKEKKEKKEKKKFQKPDFSKLKNNISKYKYHSVAVLLSFVVLTGVAYKLFVRRAQKVQKEIYQQNSLSVQGLSDDIIKENLTKEEQLAVYRAKLKISNIKEEEKEDLKSKIKIVETEIKQKKKEDQDSYIANLKKDYEGEFEKIETKVMKMKDQNLIIGFVVKNTEEEMMYKEIYAAIKEAFEKNMNVKTLNVNVFTMNDKPRKKMEINVERYEFERVKDFNVEEKEKLLAFDVFKR